MNPDSVPPGAVATPPDQPQAIENTVVSNLPDRNEIFAQIAEKIIERQEAIIGPVAVEQAKRIREFTINWPQHAVQVSGDVKAAIDELVEQYKVLFGQISVEVSKDAVSQIVGKLSAEDLPNSLK